MVIQLIQTKKKAKSHQARAPELINTNESRIIRTEPSSMADPLIRDRTLPLGEDMSRVKNVAVEKWT